jgi:hypothetical protein
MGFEIEDGDYFEVGHYFIMQNQLAIITRTYRYDDLSTGSNTTTNLVDGAMASSGMKAQYAQLICNLASCLGSSYRLTPNPARVSTDYLTGMAVAGTGGAAALPKQTCGFIRYKSLVMGKVGEGRNYIPFPPVALSDADASPSTAYVTLLAGLAGYVVTPLAVPNLLGAACRIRPTLRLHPGQPGSGADITGYLALDAWATQRRRSDFGRLNLNPFT